MTPISSADEPLKDSSIPFYLSLIIVLITVLAYFLLPGVKGFFDEAWEVLTSDDKLRIASWVDGFSWFGPLLLILAMVAQMFLVVIPSVALMVVAVLAYGPVYGSIIAFSGVYAASTFGYFIGRWCGPVVTGKIIGKRSRQKGSDFLKNYGFWAIFITRLSPFLYNDAVSLISGILKMGYWKFILANIAGIAPLVLVIAIVGGSTDGLRNWLVWSSAGSLIIFVIYVYLDKRKKQDN